MMAVYAVVCVVALLLTGSSSRVLTDNGEHHGHHADNHHSDHVDHSVHTADHATHTDYVSHHADHSEPADHATHTDYQSHHADRSEPADHATHTDYQSHHADRSEPADHATHSDYQSHHADRSEPADHATHTDYRSHHADRSEPTDHATHTDYLSHHADHVTHTDLLSHHADRPEPADHATHTDLKPHNVLSNVSPNIAKLLLPLLKDTGAESVEILPKKRTKQLIQVLPFTRKSSVKIPKKHVVEITPVHSKKAGVKPLAYILSAADADRIITTQEYESNEELNEPALSQSEAESAETETKVFSAEEPIEIVVSASNESDNVGNNSPELNVPSLETVNNELPVVPDELEPNTNTEVYNSDSTDSDADDVLILDTDVSDTQTVERKETVETPADLEPDTILSDGDVEELIKTLTANSLGTTRKSLDDTEVRDSSSSESDVIVNITPTLTDDKSTDVSVEDNNLEATVEIHDSHNPEPSRSDSEDTVDAYQPTSHTHLSKILSSLPQTESAPAVSCYRSENETRDHKSYILSFLFNK